MYYVECTNEVRSVTRVIVTIGAIQVAEVDFSNSEPED